MAIDVADDGVYDAIAIDTTGDGIPDHRFGREHDDSSLETVTRSGRYGAAVKTIVVVGSFSIFAAIAVALLEDVSVNLALNTVVNALFSNGDGRHEVAQPLSRFILIAVMLVGFFRFVDLVRDVVPVMHGKDAPQVFEMRTQRHVLRPLAHEAAAAAAAAADRDDTEVEEDDSEEAPLNPPPRVLHAPPPGVERRNSQRVAVDAIASLLSPAHQQPAQKLRLSASSLAPNALALAAMRWVRRFIYRYILNEFC